MSTKRKRNVIQPEEICKYDIIYYNAQQHNTHPKIRPFLVINKSDRNHNVTVVPITHTEAQPEKLFSRYNIKANQNCENVIKKMTLDSDKRDTYFNVAQQATIPLAAFHGQRRNPEKLGNLADEVTPKQLRQQVKNIQDEAQQIHQEYENWQQNTPDQPKLSQHNYRRLAISLQDNLKPFFKKQYYPAILPQRFREITKQKYQKYLNTKYNQTGGPEA